MVEITGYISSIIIGFTLGLIGGGGSILTLPVLVYLFGFDPVIATAYSLFIVGISSSVGALNYIRKGLLSYRTAFVFAIPSLITVYLTRKFLISAIPETIFSIGKLDLTTDLLFILTVIVTMLGLITLTLNTEFIGSKKHLKIVLLVTPAAVMVFIMRQFIIPSIPENLISIGEFTLTRNLGIMIFFAIVMLFSAISMIKGESEENGKEQKNVDWNYIVIILEGIIVGTITGLVGAGGGFLIIPALVLLTGLPMKMAVGTSLLIISFKSLLGFLGDLGNQDIDWTFLLSFSGLTIIGVFLGTYMSRFFSGEKLKKGFGWIVLIMGIYIIFNELALN